jgi:hypothetical protein
VIPVLCASDYMYGHMTVWGFTGSEAKKMRHFVTHLGPDAKLSLKPAPVILFSA